MHKICIQAWGRLAFLIEKSLEFAENMTENLRTIEESQKNVSKMHKKRDVVS